MAKKKVVELVQPTAEQVIEFLKEECQAFELDVSDLDLTTDEGLKACRLRLMKREEDYINQDLEIPGCFSRCILADKVCKQCNAQLPVKYAACLAEQEQRSQLLDEFVSGLVGEEPETTVESDQIVDSPVVASEPVHFIGDETMQDGVDKVEELPQEFYDDFDQMPEPEEHDGFTEEPVEDEPEVLLSEPVSPSVPVSESVALQPIQVESVMSRAFLDGIRTVDDAENFVLECKKDVVKNTWKIGVALLHVETSEIWKERYTSYTAFLASAKINFTVQTATSLKNAAKNFREEDFNDLGILRLNSIGRIGDPEERQKVLEAAKTGELKTAADVQAAAKQAKSYKKQPTKGRKALPRRMTALQQMVGQKNTISLSDSDGTVIDDEAKYDASIDPRYVIRLPEGVVLEIRIGENYKAHIEFKPAV